MSDLPDMDIKTIYAYDSTKFSKIELSFSGWTTTLNGNTLVNESTPFNEPTTIYARYQNVGQKEITFNYNYTDGGSATEYTTTAYTNNVTGKLSSLPNPSRNNYTFDGWYTTRDGVNYITASTVFSANSTVYAHWTYSPPIQERPGELLWEEIYNTDYGSVFREDAFIYIEHSEGFYMNLYNYDIFSINTGGGLTGSYDVLITLEQAPDGYPDNVDYEIVILTVNSGYDPSSSHYSFNRDEEFTYGGKLHALIPLEEMIEGFGFFIIMNGGGVTTDEEMAVLLGSFLISIKVIDAGYLP